MSDSGCPCKVTSASRMTQQLLRVLYVICISHVTLTSQARSVRRLCKNEIDLMGDEGVHIEPVEQSHVELLLTGQRGNSLTKRKGNAIKFEFRTTANHGMLFYGRSRQASWELLALRLVSGDLYYKIQCSTVSADVLIPHHYKLNDGRWHSVVIRFRHRGMKTQIEVDGIKDSKTYEVSCGQLTSLVFGGVTKRDKTLIDSRLGAMPHYEGCIRRVNIPTSLRSPPKYHAISICEH